MRESDLRVWGLQTKIERRKKLSMQLKALAAICVFFSVMYCLGDKEVQRSTPTQSEALATNIVWIISILVLIGIFIRDYICIREYKSIESEICDLLNKENKITDKGITGMIFFYLVLFGIDIVGRF